MVSFKKRFIVATLAAFSLAYGIANVQAMNGKRKRGDEKDVQQRTSKTVIKKIRLFVAKIALLLQKQNDVAYKKYINNATVESFRERLEKYKEQSSQIDQNDVVLNYQGKGLKLPDLLQLAEQGLNQLSTIASVSDSKEVYHYDTDVSASDASDLESENNDNFLVKRRKQQRARKQRAKRRSEHNSEGNSEQSKKSKSDEKKDVDDIDGTPLAQPSADSSSLDGKSSSQDQKLEVKEQKNQIVIEEAKKGVSTDQKPQEFVPSQAQQQLEHEEQKQQDDGLGLGLDLTEQKREEKQEAQSGLDQKHSQTERDDKKHFDDAKIMLLDAKDESLISSEQKGVQKNGGRASILLEKITDLLSYLHNKKSQAAWQNIKTTMRNITTIASSWMQRIRRSFQGNVPFIDDELFIDCLLKRVFVELSQMRLEIDDMRSSGIDCIDLTGSSSAQLGKKIYDFLKMIIDKFLHYLRLEKCVYKIFIDFNSKWSMFYCQCKDKKPVIAIGFGILEKVFEEDLTQDERKKRLYAMLFSLAHECFHIRDDNAQAQSLLRAQCYKLFEKQKELGGFSDKKSLMDFNMLTRRYEFRADAMAALLCSKLVGQYMPEAFMWSRKLLYDFQCKSSVDQCLLKFNNPDQEYDTNEFREQHILYGNHPLAKRRDEHIRACIAKFKNVALNDIDLDRDLEYEVIRGCRSEFYI